MDADPGLCSGNEYRYTQCGGYAYSGFNTNHAGSFGTWKAACSGSSDIVEPTEGGLSTLESATEVETIIVYSREHGWGAICNDLFTIEWENVMLANLNSPDC
jgi:hypothetical protein